MPADIGTPVRDGRPSSVLSLREYIDRTRDPDHGQASSFRRYAHPVDQQVIGMLSLARPVKSVVEAVVEAHYRYSLSQLLAHSARVTSKQFPSVHRCVGQAVAALRIVPPQVFVKQDPAPNAYTLGTDQHAILVVTSALVDVMGNDELLFVVAHECGHIHAEHTTYHTLAGMLTTGVVPRVAQPIIMPLKLALMTWSRRSEITADRAGLLCSRDFKASSRALAILATGSHKLADELDLKTFVDQVRDVRDSATVFRLTELLEDHPLLAKRVQALSLFGRSRAYQDWTGSSAVPGPTLEREQLDALTTELLRIV